jgi:hypothetical protein
MARFRGRAMVRGDGPGSGAAGFRGTAWFRGRPWPWCVSYQRTGDEITKQRLVSRRALRLVGSCW